MCLGYQSPIYFKQTAVGFCEICDHEWVVTLAELSDDVEDGQLGEDEMFRGAKKVKCPKCGIRVLDADWTPIKHFSR